MKTNLGKVAITPKGTWNSTTVYTALDTVNFGGGSWLAKRGNIAVTPTEGDDWMQLSAKGADAELTKDGIVSALGFSPQNEQWELITTVTTDADATWLRISADSEGNRFSLSKMLVLMDFPEKCEMAQTYAGTQDYKWLVYMNGRTYRSLIFYSERICDKIVRGYGVLSSYESIAGNVDSGNAPYSTGVRQISADNIAGFSYFGNKSTILAGTVVNIYGIRVI